ncbi:hypothetical protein Dsin_003484 [Dipteronia sinensis]|uniref:Reverse transcriptase zinc-binding domain-containing protein n=1 Tax=Dipteronia sinensis TaxID=43782 RepID=A0AAE0B911_9ROSI|nr:hypothetical protein Dsin_003484 [Dipteronia sinensis]
MIISLRFLSPSGGWNNTLIEQSFTKEDVVAIQSIPIGSRSCGDSLVWHNEETGAFNVKSGYWVARNMVVQASSSNSASSINTDWWKRLWNLKIPQKIKKFIWKGCFDWIPTMYNLCLRRIPVVDICPLCNKVSKTTLHTLWDCKIFKHARKQWIPSNTQIRGQYKNFFDLLDCSSSLGEEDLEVFCTIVWRVWSLRNAKTHGAPYTDVCDVFVWTKCFLLEYKECNMGVAKNRSMVSRRNVLWSPPSPGFFKVNCDAAIDVRGGRIGFGLVIRDSTGGVMASSSQVMAGYFNAQAAEAIAILRGIQFSKDSGLYLCYVESDL